MFWNGACGFISDASGFVEAGSSVACLFCTGSVVLLLSSLICPWALLPLGVYILALFLESLFVNKSLPIALLSIVTSFIQLGGYGMGFIGAFVRKVILKQKVDVEAELKKHYKKKA